jgi:flagellar basal-body rod modification protein FlgD
MSTISAISSASQTTPASSVATSTVTNPKTLGVNDFMKLLATQFQQQDPMKPMDDTAFIAQTAQFTGLQQTNTLVQQMTQLAAGQDRVTANSYLGRQVTFDAGNGATVTGVVSAVDASGSAPQLMLNGQTFPLSAVLRVEPAPLSPIQPTAQSATSGS